MADPRGAFIVLEGLDGAGTTTLSRRLADVLRVEGRRVLLTHEPSDGPVGLLIRQVLRHRFVCPGGEPPGWQTMALLFAADRHDHLQSEIRPALARGEVVISDRYDASTMAYQTATSPDPRTGPWIQAVHGFALRPDLVIVLDVPAETGERRRTARGDAPEVFERLEVQRKVAEVYRHLEDHFPRDRIVHVDGTLDASAVACAALGPVRELLAGAGRP